MEHKCQVKTGLFSLRSCDEPTNHQCSECGRYACKKHSQIRYSKFVCRHCAWDHDDYDSVRFYSSDHFGQTISHSENSSDANVIGPDFFEGGGGEFGGGGASLSDWDSVEGIDESQFTDQDFAAFDDVKDFDKNAGGGEGVYDS